MTLLTIHVKARKKVFLKNEIVKPQARLQTQVAKQDFSCQRKTKLAKSRPVVITNQNHFWYKKLQTNILEQSYALMMQFSMTADGYFVCYNLPVRV